MTTEANPTPENDATATGADVAATDEGTLLGGEADKVDPETVDQGGDEAAKEGGDADKAEADKADADKKDDPEFILTGAPEKYDLAATMPEGMAFDEEAFAAVEPVLREMDLSVHAAAKLVGAYAEKVIPLIEQRANQSADEAGAEIRAQWARETQADKELGGAKLEETKSLAARAMARFLPQGEEGQTFRTFLNESGLGNHPQMVRLLSRVGRELGEASADKSTGASQQVDKADRWYGESKG